MGEARVSFFVFSFRLQVFFTSFFTEDENFNGPHPEQDAVGRASGRVQAQLPAPDSSAARHSAPQPLPDPYVENSLGQASAEEVARQLVEQSSATTPGHRKVVRKKKALLAKNEKFTIDEADQMLEEECEAKAQ